MNYLSHPVVIQQPAVGSQGGPLGAILSFSQEELEHSLGESAAQGAAGVVLWVSWLSTSTKVSSAPGWGGGGVGVGWGWGCQGRPQPTFYSCSLGWPGGECFSVLGGPMHGHGVPDAPLPT